MEKGWLDCRWLDYVALMDRIGRHGEHVMETKYFTARATFPPDRYRRQRTYLEALKRRGGIHIYEGSFQTRSRRCDDCKGVMSWPQEKKTDVNIAVQMVSDAVTLAQYYDAVWLVSGDTDLVPAIEFVKAQGKRFFLIDPPARHTRELREMADGHAFLTKPKLNQSQLPNPVEWVRQGRMRRLYPPKGWTRQ